MAFEFKLPDVGEGIAEAEVVRWLVEEGEEVREDQPLAEIETDKAVVEMPAPATGRVLRLAVAAGEVARVGELFVVIDDGTELASGEGAAPPEGVTRAGAGAAPATAARRPRATPATRRLARELGVDLQGVEGTGPGGRISDDDVRAAAGRAATAAGGAAAPASPASTVEGPRRAPAATDGEDERIPLRGLRRRTTQTMTSAWRSIPHTVGFHEVDAEALVALRSSLQSRAQDAGVQLTLTAFFVKAAARALIEHPLVNSAFDEEREEIVRKHRRNIGVAVDTADGLIVPVVHDADRRSLFGIARELARLTAAARDRSVSVEDLQDGTFTITNHGPLGGVFGTSIIKPPEAAILGFGAARAQPVVRDGAVVPGLLLPLSFASDHRIIDGDLSIGFCLTVRGLLEDPVQLLVEEG